MGYTYDRYAWAELTANTVHAFYNDVTDYLSDAYEAEWQDSFWEDGAFFPVMIHMMALHLLTEARKRPATRCITLPEMLRTLSVEEFAEAFWHEYKEDPNVSNRAQALVAANDTLDPLYTPVRLAKKVFESYEDGWVDLDEDAFAEAWEWFEMEDKHSRNRITWEA